MRYRPMSMCCMLAAALAFAGCGPDSTGPGERESAAVQIQASAAASVAGIVVEISAVDISPSLVANLVYDAATSRWTGSLVVPAGTGRTVAGRAYNEQGTLTHEGSTTMTVVAGVDNAVELTLEPLDSTGTVPIIIIVAAHTVEITSGPTSLAAAQSAIFTAEVAGSSCVSTWASTNPAIAAVSSVAADGLSATVTGHIQGSVNIVANCGGLAAAAALDVTP